jgi:hypothetical protein
LPVRHDWFGAVVGMSREVLWEEIIKARCRQRCR